MFLGVNSLRSFDLLPLGLGEAALLALLPPEGVRRNCRPTSELQQAQRQKRLMQSCLSNDDVDGIHSCYRGGCVLFFDSTQLALGLGLTC